LLSRYPVNLGLIDRRISGSIDHDSRAQASKQPRDGFRVRQIKFGTADLTEFDTMSLCSLGKCARQLAIGPENKEVSTDGFA
jgi:hypothetical protein